MKESQYTSSLEHDLARVIETSKAPAISRAASLLRRLGKSNVPLSLQSIARELGLVPSTCLYVLRALVAEEFVAFDADTKRYSLEAGVLTLARDWLRRSEEHTSELQSLMRISYAVFCLKKKKKHNKKEPYSNNTETNTTKIHRNKSEKQQHTHTHPM